MSKVTPYRKTHILLDPAQPALVEPAFSMMRQLDEIGRGELAVITNVAFVPKVGWQLERYDPNLQHEKSAGASSVIRNLAGPYGGFLFGPTVVETKAFRKRTDLTGVSYDASVQDSGDVFVTKQVPTSGTWASSLTADEAAFPGPPATDDAATERRWGTTLQPDRVLENRALMFRLTLGSYLSDWQGHVATAFFGGPANVFPDFYGYGQYALRLSASGRAELWERGRERAGSVNWRQVDTFRWAAAGSPIGTSIVLIVRRHYQGEIKAYPYGAISVTSGVGAGSGAQQGGGLLSRHYVRGKQQDLIQHWYVVKRQLPVDANASGQVTWGGETETPGAVKEQPIRLGVGGAVRPQIQVARVQYKSSGSLLDAPFSLPCILTARATLQLFWWGDVPLNTTLDAKLGKKDATGAFVELTEDTAASEPYHKVYQSPAYTDRVTQLWVKFTFATTDPEVTPTLQGYQCLRDGYIETMIPGQFEPVDFAGAGQLVNQAIGDVEVFLSGPDPSLEYAQFKVADLINSMTKLHTRGDLLCKIETEYDSGDSSKRAQLFRGVVRQPQATREGHETRPGRAAPSTGTIEYPHRNWRNYDCSVVSMYQLLREALPAARIDWSDEDPDAPIVNGRHLPYKVTDAIRYMLGWAGFPSTMIDVPDNELRLWSNGGQELYVEPFQPVDDLLMRLAREYLGQQLVFDPNAGTYGKWRLRPALTSPYTNLAAFVTTGPAAGKVAHNVYSYATDGATAPILRRDGRSTLRTYVRPPEGNILIVSGTGTIGDKEGSLHRLTQMAVNVRSYNFLGLDSGHAKYPSSAHPDYLGRMLPIVVVDPGLTTPAAVNWVTRRIFDIACYAKKRVTFEAPLVLVTDPNDSEIAGPPARYRSLRYYDPVTVDGTQYLVVSVRIAYAKDAVQTAVYELEAPREAFI